MYLNRRDTQILFLFLIDFCLFYLSNHTHIQLPLSKDAVQFLSGSSSIPGHIYPNISPAYGLVCADTTSYLSNQSTFNAPRPCWAFLVLSLFLLRSSAELFFFCFSGAGFSNLLIGIGFKLFALGFFSAC